MTTSSTTTTPITRRSDGPTPRTTVRRLPERGHYDAATELFFSLATPVGDTWLSGPGERNQDKFAHARPTQVAPDTVLLEWEDLSGGGDADFNDCIISIAIK